MTSAEAMDAVDGWNAYAAGKRYDPTGSHAWRRGRRWRQASDFNRPNHLCVALRAL
jgi:hypothetical protein